MQNGIYIQKIQNIGSDHVGNLYIEINNAKAKWKEEKACYTYYGYRGEIISWNTDTQRGYKKIKKIDIITMILNFDDNGQILKVSINNGENIIVSNNVASFNGL